MMYHDQAADRFLAELDRTDTPLSVAAALGALGINPYRAAEHQVRFLLEAVQASNLLHLVRDGESGSGMIAKPLPVEELLDELYRSPRHEALVTDMLKPGAPDPLIVKRVGAMTQVFIDRV